MNKAELYIANEMLRYFPEGDISVKVDDESETITVHVFTDLAPTTPLILEMEIGSDDDWFRFVDDRGMVITIPLMKPEP